MSTRPFPTSRLLLPLLAVLGAACTGGDGGGGSDAATSAGSCSASSTRVLGPLAEKGIYGLRTAGEYVVFASILDPLTSPSVIERVGRDGSNRMVLHTSAMGRRVLGLATAGTDVYFLESNTDVVTAGELFKLAVAGGAPVRIGSAKWTNGRLFAVADGQAYLNVITNEGTRFDRVDLATGAVTVVTTVTGIGAPGKETLAGNYLYFAAGGTGSAASTTLTLYMVAKDATMGTAQLVGSPGLHSTCFLGLGGLAVTPTKLVCGFSGVMALSLDGASPEMLVAPDPLKPASHIPVAWDGETVYLVERSTPAKNVALRKVASFGGPVGNAACDVRQVEFQLRDGIFPIQTEYQVALGATDVFWVERRSEGSAAAAYEIRRASR